MMRHVVGLALVTGFIVAAGCSNGRQLPTTPTPATAPPTVPQPPPPSGSPNWHGDATVLSVVQGAGGPCGWGTTPGATQQNILWQLAWTDGSVSLDEDVRNWPTDDVPYSGTLTGHHFTASYSSSDDYLKYVCQFKGGELSGDFNADFTGFDALETLIWGPPGSESIVKRQWVASRF